MPKQLADRNRISHISSIIWKVDRKSGVEIDAPLLRKLQDQRSSELLRQ
jgi:hypothetical protein